MAFNSVKKAEDSVVVRNLLVSTYDKAGLADFVRGIVEASSTASARADSATAVPGDGLRFYSTGGTYDELAKALAGLRGPELVKVSDYTGQPEMKGGLVKTLDWKIYLGLLAESGDASHEADLERAGAVAFDMVIANLYPFADASADPNASPEELRQRIDIGGPCMIRAAAKNYLRVASVSSPTQYEAVLAELRATGGKTSLETRRRLAAEAFSLTSRFDATVSARLGGLSADAVASSYGLR
jgi:phosphoribosylaminoimidazolecarboxamide formyltransferase / IMP cyclohydrolase